jgi:hypothetical protein
VNVTVTFDPWRILRTLLGLVCLALVTSIGGAGIVAAPVTLPLIWGLPLAMAVAAFVGYSLTQRAVEARATAKKSAGRFVTGTA